MSPARTTLTLSILVVLLLTGSVYWYTNATSGPLPAQHRQQDQATDVVAHESLPNLHELAEGVFSGGQPEGRIGYQQLAEMGVKTVISVDGARPDIELAREFGLTYIHLPHGYDGIESEHAAKLAKAVESVDEPVYVHCHHGKHRSPAAVAVACVGLNRVSSDEAIEFLKQAGTSPEYQGLYHSVSRSVPIPTRTLAQMESSFPEVAPATPLVQSMVRIEKHFATLTKLVEREGQPLPKDPDLDAAHEALLLFEQFTELRRQTTAFDSGYDERMGQSAENAKALHQLLEALPSQVLPKEFPQQQAAKLLGLIRQDCKHCHRTYRD